MTTAVAANPFALMVDPAEVRQHVDRSEQLSQLSQRQCHPLDRAVIRCASAELVASASSSAASLTSCPRRRRRAPWS